MPGGLFHFMAIFGRLTGPSSLSREAARKATISRDPDVLLIEELHERERKRRYPYEWQWYWNAAFVNGYHYTEWNKDGQRFQRRQAPSWRVQYQANFLYAWARDVIARLTRNDPAWDVVPRHVSDRARSAAKAGEKMLRYYWEHLGAPVKLIELATHIAVFGTGFLRVGWNAKAGRRIIVPRMELRLGPDGELREVPLLDDDGDPRMEKIVLGDLDFSVKAPFEIYFDRTPQLGEARWLLDVTERDMGYFTEHYTDGDKVMPDVYPTSGNYYTWRLETLAGPFGQTAFSGRAEGEEKAYEKQYWELPSDRHPDGRYIATGGGVKLHEGDLPWGDDIPYYKFDFFLPPGRAWGMSNVEQGVPIQRQYNRGSSQIVENINMMARPKWTVPKGAGLKETSMTSEPGEVLEYNAVATRGVGPQQVPIAPLPRHVIEAQERRLLELRDVMGWHEVSKGQVPPGVESGVAIQLLVEQDETPLGPVIRSFEYNLARAGKKLLQIVRENVTEEIVGRIVGPYGEIELFSFTGSDLPEEFDVQVRSSSALPQTVAGRHQTMLNYWDRGLIVDSERRPSPDKFLEMSGFAQPEGARHRKEIERKRAQRENERMLAAMPVQPTEIDDHQVHYDVHTDFMRSDEFEAMPQERQAPFWAHIAAQRQLWAQMANPPQVAGRGSTIQAQPQGQMGQGGQAAMQGMMERAVQQLGGGNGPQPA